MNITTERATGPAAAPPAPTWRDRARLNRTALGVLGACLLVYGVSVLLVPDFATFAHVTDTLQIAGFLGIVAVGEGIVILGSGIDLSVANTVTGAGVLASSLAAAGAPSPVVIGGALLAGVVIGAVNGVGVTVFGIPPLIMTLATGNVVQGVVLVATNGSPKSAAPGVLESIANTDLGGGVTGTIVVWLVLGVASALYLGRTRSGRYLYAVGAGPRAARLAGVPVARVTAGTYVISGLTAAIAGCLLLGYTGISSATMGDTYMLPAIAAVVLGGTSILGGSGGTAGTLLGVFLLTTVESLLTIADVSPAGRQILEGVILLAIIIAYNARAIRRR